jgi:hypothetical protein
MDLDKILIKLEKQGWKLEKDFLDNNQNFLQDLVDETEKAINFIQCCKSDSEQLRDEYLQPELDKYKNIKVERTTGKSDM